jgi:hypothetical protein
MRRAAFFTLLIAGLALAALAFRQFYQPGAREAVPAARAAANQAPAAAPGLLQDPINPERPVRLDQAERVSSGDWVKARPGFQASRSPAERGGIEPCAPQRVDTSSFTDWGPLSRGRFIAPKEPFLDASGHFDLVIHLHGDDPVRRELVESRQRFVLLAITLGPNQGYAPLFSDRRAYPAIIAEIEQVLSKRMGAPARAGHVALSAWSAGFVGVEAALAQPVSKDVDAVILIDGLHAPRRDRSAFEAQLKPFVDYASRAAAGERFMFVSHSSIDPPGFASTTECAHYLIASLGGKPEAVRRSDAFGQELVEYFTRGEFHVRGHAGNDKADHCAELAVLRDAYAALGRRWARESKAR